MLKYNIENIILSVPDSYTNHDVYSILRFLTSSVLLS